MVSSTLFPVSSTIWACTPKCIRVPADQINLLDDGWLTRNRETANDFFSNRKTRDIQTFKQ